MIRRATILDQNQIEELRQKALSKVSIEDYSLLQQRAILEQWKDEDFCKVLSEEEGYVIVFDNKILAFGSYHAEQNQITQLYVDPEYQGWYFGKKLLQQLEIVAQTNGFLDITVNAYLPTVAFFKNIIIVPLKRIYTSIKTKKLSHFLWKNTFNLTKSGYNFTIEQRKDLLMLTNGNLDAKTLKTFNFLNSLKLNFLSIERILKMKTELTFDQKTVILGLLRKQHNMKTNLYRHYQPVKQHKPRRIAKPKG
ncbi:GNAT family N-acetyltransferase [Spiroplasma poulsonii]|uniref:N-acetyltransferase domain-containing protein n=1 Tax=Spiroplasma poulsonii TaxID=2138 RepID=A0A2P6FDW3_9MOLU|nr:GNAT family N-acetyltransferase [Spiroplasma poulsonii]KAF0850636.1 acetyltransferase [Spiroplasma poulsonii]PQM31648.1 hypothetical protein SMSRO_SF014950 [Spiroplasma poulsonii]PWF96674.1 hypothetical protein SMSE_21210 [Spiroplasma poulsonii]PWF97250.1 hypothetical protein SMH99_20590 [Spiroplasma poulsonii]